MNDRGIWTQEEANTGHAFSYRLAEWIGDRFDKKIPIYDFGCGTGTYVKYFDDRGFHIVEGIEGSRLNTFESTKVCYGDLSKPIGQLEMGNVISIEVWEHIPKEYDDIFIENITSSVVDKGFLILSCAHEGQQGYGHVNCKPGWQVVEMLENKGFALQELLTKELRSVIEGHVAYLKENIFVFKKDEK